MILLASSGFHYFFLISIFNPTQSPHFFLPDFLIFWVKKWMKPALLKVCVHTNHLRMLGKSKFWFSRSGMSLKLLSFWLSPRICREDMLGYAEDHTLYNRVEQLLFNPSIITAGSVLKVCGECHSNSTFLGFEIFPISTQKLLLTLPGSFSMLSLCWIHKIRPHLWGPHINKIRSLEYREISLSK